MVIVILKKNSNDDSLYHKPLSDLWIQSSINIIKQGQTCSLISMVLVLTVCATSVGPDWFTAKVYNKILFSAYLISVWPLMVSFMGSPMREAHFSMPASMLAKERQPSTLGFSMSIPASCSLALTTSQHAGISPSLTPWLITLRNVPNLFSL